MKNDPDVSFLLSQYNTYLRHIHGEFGQNTGLSWIYYLGHINVSIRHRHILNIISLISQTRFKTIWYLRNNENYFICTAMRIHSFFLIILSHTMFKFDQVLWSPQKVRVPPQNVSEYQNIHDKDWKNAKKIQ